MHLEQGEPSVALTSRRGAGRGGVGGAFLVSAVFLSIQGCHSNSAVSVSPAEPFQEVASENDAIVLATDCGDGGHCALAGYSHQPPGFVVGTHLWFEIIDPEGATVKKLDWTRTVGIPALKGIVAVDDELVLLRLAEDPFLVNGQPVNETWRFFSWKTGAEVLTSTPTQRSEQLGRGVKLFKIQDVECVRGTPYLLLHWITRTPMKDEYGLRYELLSHTGQIHWAAMDETFYSDKGFDATYKIVDSLRARQEKHILTGLVSRFQVLIGRPPQYRTFIVGEGEEVTEVQGQ